MWKSKTVVGLLSCCALVQPFAKAIARGDEEVDKAAEKESQIVVLGTKIDTETEESEQALGKKPQIVVLRTAVDTTKVEGEPAATSQLWLGVALKSIEGDLAAFLGSTTGVLIDQVQPDSPAAKAGLLKGDIVLSVDGRETKGPEDLQAIMRSASSGVSLKLQVLRKADRIDVSVTPEPRSRAKADLQGSSLEAVLKGLPEGQVKIENLLNPESRMRVFRFGDPSVIALGDEAKLEGNISIHMTKEDEGQKIEIKITKEKDQPAEITVTQGDDVQTVSEDQLEKLPDEVRSWVQSALSGKKVRSWYGVPDRSQEDGQSQPFTFREIPEMKELSKLLESQVDGEGNADFRIQIERLARTAKDQAQEAVRQALEQARVSADQSTRQAKDATQQAEQLARQAEEIARRHADQALEAAKHHAELAQEQAKVQAKAAEQTARTLADKAKQDVYQYLQQDQVAELKAMIEQLRKEIAELRGSKSE